MYFGVFSTSYGSSLKAIWQAKEDFDRNSSTTGEATKKENIEIGEDGTVSLSKKKFSTGSQTLDNKDHVGFFSSVALDSSNNSHIAYYDMSNQDLKYATNVSGQWKITSIDTYGDIGQYSSISTDKNNRVHVSYYDKSKTDLKYATNISGSWAYSTIDSSGDIGQYSSIAIDYNNKVHFSYYDKSRENLKYASKESNLLNIKILDDKNETGLFSSISARKNVFCVAYYDEDNKDLKYYTDFSPYYESGTIGKDGIGLRYENPDGGRILWSKLRWDADLPQGTDIEVAFKTSDDKWDGTYTAFQKLSSGNNISEDFPAALDLQSNSINLPASSRIELMVKLLSDGTETPILSSLALEIDEMPLVDSKNITIYKSDGSEINTDNRKNNWTNSKDMAIKLIDMQGFEDSLYLIPEGEIKPFNEPFDGLNIISGNAEPPGSSGEFLLKNLEENSYRLRVRLRDNIGRTSAWTYLNNGGIVFQIDRTPPKSRVIINNGESETNNNSVVLDLSSAFDPGSFVSGVDQMLISENPDFLEAKWQPYAASTQYSFSAGYGLKTIFVKFKDKAGNISDNSIIQSDWSEESSYESIHNIVQDNGHLRLSGTMNGDFEQDNLSGWFLSGISLPSIISTENSSHVLEATKSAIVNGTYPGYFSHFENDIYDGIAYREFVVPENYVMKFIAKVAIGSHGLDHVRINIYDMENGMANIKQWDTGYGYYNAQGGLVTGVETNYGPVTEYSCDLSQYAGKKVRFSIRAHNGGYFSSAIIDSINFPLNEFSTSFEGEILSNVFENSGFIQMVKWDPFDQQQKTGLEVELRAGNTQTPDNSWTPWIEVNNGAENKLDSVQGYNYGQYRLALISFDNFNSPLVDEVKIIMPASADSIYLAAD